MTCVVGKVEPGVDALVEVVGVVAGKGVVVGLFVLVIVEIRAEVMD